MSYINVLFYDRNKQHTAGFEESQQAFLLQRGSDSSRRIHTASSLNELKQIDLQVNAPTVAFFDAYDGDKYDICVVQAAEWVKDHSRELDPPYHQRRVVLVRTEADLEGEIQDALQRDIFMRHILKMKGSPLQAIQELLKSAEFSY